jgi:hypothetical protein
MGEWWTYRPSDFLMFSAASHARLLESYNRDHWPLHLVMLGAAVVLAASMARPSARRLRVSALVLAFIWAWVAASFYWDRFAEINTAATWFAVAWALQAAALLACAGFFAPPGTPRRWARTGSACLVVAVLLWPLLAPATGRSWPQADYFGMAPEPTALATLGWLLGAAPRARLALLIVPMLSLLIGATMLWLLYGPR